MSFPDPASRCTASSASSTSSGGWTNGCKGKRARRTSSRRLPMRTPIAAALALALATMTTVTAGSAQQKPTHADADRLVQGTGQLPSGWKARLDKPDANLDTRNGLAEQ